MWRSVSFYKSNKINALPQALLSQNEDNSRKL